MQFVQAGAVGKASQLSAGVGVARVHAQQGRVVRHALRVAPQDRESLRGVTMQLSLLGAVGQFDGLFDRGDCLVGETRSVIVAAQQHEGLDANRTRRSLEPQQPFELLTRPCVTRHLVEQRSELLHRGLRLFQPIEIAGCDPQAQGARVFARGQLELPPPQRDQILNALAALEQAFESCRELHVVALDHVQLLQVADGSL